jgi:hypothetical protein
MLFDCEKKNKRLMNDLDITCSDCNKSFVFTVKQQAFHNQKGFEKPKRCASCKANKKSYHESIKEGFKNNSVGEGYFKPNNDLVTCSFCYKPCHQEKDCRLKASATCKKCGTVGMAVSKGFARGLRTNTSEFLCNCNMRWWL